MTERPATETGELTYRRVHHASPELLFDCMTTPEHLTHFWGPTGTTTPVGGIVVDRGLVIDVALSPEILSMFYILVCVRQGFVDCAP